jgi:hypothetical protein
MVAASKCAFVTFAARDMAEKVFHLFFLHPINRRSSAFAGRCHAGAFMQRQGIPRQASMGQAALLLRRPIVISTIRHSSSSPCISIIISTRPPLPPPPQRSGQNLLPQHGPHLHGRQQTAVGDLGPRREPCFPCTPYVGEGYHIPLPFPRSAGERPSFTPLSPIVVLLCAGSSASKAWSANTLCAASVSEMPEAAAA